MTKYDRILAAIDDQGNRIDGLLQEREKTHGSFQSNAVISQDIKELLRHCSGWHELSYIQREALEVIALKISRIMSGQSFFADHWDDIAGYAKLASKEIEGCSPTTQPSGSPSPQPRTLSRRKVKSGRSKTL